MKVLNNFFILINKMYYRDNGKIIENFKIIELDGSENPKHPLWLIILLTLLLLLAVSIPIYKLFKK